VLGHHGWSFTGVASSLHLATCCMASTAIPVQIHRGRSGFQNKMIHRNRTKKSCPFPVMVAVLIVPRSCGPSGPWQIVHGLKHAVSDGRTHHAPPHSSWSWSISVLCFFRITDLKTNSNKKNQLTRVHRWAPVLGIPSLADCCLLW
jgi:hypothetical protein